MGLKRRSDAGWRATLAWSSLTVLGCVSGGALFAGFIRGVVVDGDPEYYILMLAALAAVVAVVALARLVSRR